MLLIKVWSNSARGDEESETKSKLTNGDILNYCSF